MSKFEALVEDVMSKKHNVSAGLLMTHEGKVFLARATLAKIVTCWGIPKGHVDRDEDIFEAAKREFYEETGIHPPEDKLGYHKLVNTITKGGKLVHCWQFEGSGDEVFSPPKEFYMTIEVNSKMVKLPECDRGKYFTKEEAKKILIPYQLPLLDSTI